MALSLATGPPATPDFARIAAAWPSLPPSIRVAVLTIIEAATGAPPSNPEDPEPEEQP